MTVSGFIKAAKQEHKRPARNQHKMNFKKIRKQ